MMNQEQMRAEIARQEASLIAMRAQLHAACNEETLLPLPPGLSDDQRSSFLRENWRREENRRQAVLAIGQSIAAVEERLAFLRRQIA